MVRLRRPNAPSDVQASDSLGGAYAGLPDDPALGDAVVLRPGGAGAIADSGVHADGPAFTDLLPDVLVAERDRRREQRLVEAACRGEESAIEALYRTHYDAIYRYVLLRLGSPSAAEDVTSQVFLGMVRGLGRYSDEGKPFVAWLYGIAQKQIAFFLRGQSRAPVPWTSTPPPSWPPRAPVPTPPPSSRSCAAPWPRHWPRCPTVSARSSCCATSCPSR